MSHHDLRVGDSERDETAEQLSEHFAAGRLEHVDFTQRTERALGARTQSELDSILIDLPPLSDSSTPPDLTATPQPVLAAQSSLRDWQQKKLAPWAIFAVFFVVLWAATGMGYFWPFWPILGWGLGVVISGIAAHQASKGPPAPWL